MANTTNVRAKALRIRVAVESLTNPDDVMTVRDYLSEMELVAAQQEAEDAQHKVWSLH